RRSPRWKPPRPCASPSTSRRTRKSSASVFLDSSMEAAHRGGLHALRVPYPRQATGLIFRTENVFMKRIIGLMAAATAIIALAIIQSGAAGPGSLGTFFFGPKLVRAEVIMNEAGVIHDYRVDRGKIRAIAQGSLTLLEKDGTLVTVSVAPTADIRLGGVSVPFAQLRRGFPAATVRDGPA